MRRRGHNIGQLCRREFKDVAYLLGFGTDRGTVAAASERNGPMRIMSVRPAIEKSYERRFHAVTQDIAEPKFFVPMRGKVSLQEVLKRPRLERAIGVIYRPETELASHYFQAVLSKLFGEYIWFDETRAVSPFATADIKGMPDTYPFGL